MPREDRHGSAQARPVINHITNLPLTERSGGWSGINVALFEELAKEFDARYVGPINPPSDLVQKAVSKAARSAGLPGTFHFFSDRRLRAIAREVSERCEPGAALDFFHGQTAWIRADTGRPYATYVDAPFPTYVSIYLPDERFTRADIARIARLEADWLGRASAICFGSQWALEETVRRYALPAHNMHVVGVGGCMAVPEGDRWSGGRKFLFISLDFHGKGGLTCWNAFRMVRAVHGDASLTIVGQRPPDEVIATPGVTYAGRFRKDAPADMEAFRAILGEAFALIHPTRMDTMGMVIIEAAYHGCPTIAPRAFGIPELVRDGTTGHLVDVPLAAEDVARQMLSLCAHPDEYQQMRRAARAFASRQLTWRAVGERVRDAVRPHLRTRE